MLLLSEVKASSEKKGVVTSELDLKTWLMWKFAKCFSCELLSRKNSFYHLQVTGRVFLVISEIFNSVGITTPGNLISLTSLKAAW